MTKRWKSSSMESDYMRGLDYGMFAWALEIHDAQWSSDASAVRYETPELQEGYRDAADDSDDMPDPVDLEETFVP